MIKDIVLCVIIDDMKILSIHHDAYCFLYQSIILEIVGGV